MFLNFQLHASAIPFTVVNLTVVNLTVVNLTSLYESPEDTRLCYAFWDRTLMGFAPSAYNSIRWLLSWKKLPRGIAISGLDRAAMAVRKSLPVGNGVIKSPGKERI